MFLHVLAGFGLAFLILSIIPYLVWHFLLSVFFPTQDLKKRYDAHWALVTGASSGEVQFVQDMLVCRIPVTYPCLPFLNNLK